MLYPGDLLLTILTRALDLSDGVAALTGLLDRPIEPHDLIQLAKRQTGLNEFGDSGFVDPLTRLLTACSSESSLSLIGRRATRWDVIRFLSNLLTLQDAVTRQPDIASVAVPKPIFITGLPRSGTTFLHRLC